MNGSKRHLNAQIDNPICASRANCRNVSINISRTHKRVVIQDRNRQFDDVLMQGEEMAQFLSELKVFAKENPKALIQEALATAIEPYVAQKWC